MDFKQIQQDFELKYCRWSIDEFQQEIENGFPLLSTIKDDLVRNLLVVMRSLSKQEQIRFSIALVKRFHEKAVMALGEKVTPEAEDLIKRFRGSLASPTQEERDIERLKQIGEWVSVRRNKLARLVKRELDPVCGSLVTFGDATGWQYRVFHGEFIIYTSIDVGARSYQLTYEHRVTTREWLKVEEALSRFTATGGINNAALTHLRSLGISDPTIKQGISYLSALGIGSQTVWSDITDDEASEVAKNLAKLCTKFINALPELLPGK